MYTKAGRVIKVKMLNHCGVEFSAPADNSLRLITTQMFSVNRGLTSDCCAISHNNLQLCWLQNQWKIENTFMSSEINDPRKTVNTFFDQFTMAN